MVIVDTDNENLFVFDFARENSIDVWLGILENVSKIDSHGYECSLKHIFRKLLRMNLYLFGLMELQLEEKPAIKIGFQLRGNKNQREHIPCRNHYILTL